jgi:hypothetical protein
MGAARKAFLEDFIQAQCEELVQKFLLLEPGASCEFVREALADMIETAYHTISPHKSLATSGSPPANTENLGRQSRSQGTKVSTGS